MGFKRLLYIFMIIMCSIFMAGCAVHASPDDYAVNEGYEVKGSSSKNTGSGDAGGGTSGIAKDKIKVGVIHLSDPAEGSGYTYTHDIGIQGMQQNLGLSDSQIIRKNNIR